MAMKDNLKRIRKEKGLTQRQLADKSKVSFSMVSKLESGEQANPSLETVEKIATALGIEPYQLLSNLDLDKISQIANQVDEEITNLLRRPEQITYQKIHDLLISDHGQETFGINLKAISPEELEQIEVEIMNFIRFQFERFKNKPSIYES